VNRGSAIETVYKPVLRYAVNELQAWRHSWYLWHFHKMMIWSSMF